MFRARIPLISGFAWNQAMMGIQVIAQDFFLITKSEILCIEIYRALFGFRESLELNTIDSPPNFLELLFLNVEYIRILKTNALGHSF